MTLEELKGHILNHKSWKMYPIRVGDHYSIVAVVRGEGQCDMEHHYRTFREALSVAANYNLVINDVCVLRGDD